MSLLLPILPISTMSPMACHPCQVSLVSSSQHKLAHPPLLKLVSIWPECPPLPPFLGHLCVPPAHDCYYDGGNDQCCCNICPEIVRFSCIPDKITGSGRWKSDLCPEGPEGCGSKGEWWRFGTNSQSLRNACISRVSFVYWHPLGMPIRAYWYPNLEVLWQSFWQNNQITGKMLLRI